MNKQIQERGLGRLEPSEITHSMFAPATSVGPLAQVELGHEQTSTLSADAVNLQQLIGHVDLLLAAAYAALGKGITKPASNALDDFHNGLSDLRSDLQGMYDRYDAELESRDAVLEREHERAETAMVWR